MTPEEAAEVILGGVFWCGCPDCGASGLVGAQKGEIPNFPGMEGVMKVPCKRCYGTGSVPRPPYEEACHLLGKPVPKYERPRGARSPLFDEIDRQPLRPERYIMHKETWQELIDLHSTLPIQKKDPDE